MHNDHQPNSYTAEIGSAEFFTLNFDSLLEDVVFDIPKRCIPIHPKFILVGCIGRGSDIAHTIFDKYFEVIARGGQKPASSFNYLSIGLRKKRGKKRWQMRSSTWSALTTISRFRDIPAAKLSGHSTRPLFRVDDLLTHKQLRRCSEITQSIGNCTFAFFRAAIIPQMGPPVLF